MASTKNGKNGKVDRLEEAMATLLQNQAMFVTQMLAINQRVDERSARSDERFERMDERLARVEAILLQHSQILKEHTLIMQALPEAVRERMGFKPPA